MVKRSMWAYAVVIFQVGFKNAPQLPFIEHDHAIQALTPNRTDQSLDVGTLPGRSRRDELLLDNVRSTRRTKADP